MMQMSGLRMSVYWVVAYIYDIFLYFIVMLVIFVTSIVFKMRLFTQTKYSSSENSIFLRVFLNEIQFLPISSLASSCWFSFSSSGEMS